MLKFTHAGESVEVDVEKLGVHEGIALQKATGHKLTAFMKAIEAMDMEALAALGWVLLKYRMGQSEVTFEDVCEGRVVVNISDFEDSEAGKPGPPRAAKAAGRTRS